MVTETIRLDGKDYVLRYGLKSLFFFESLTGHTYGPDPTASDVTLLIFASLYAYNPDFRETADLDKFVDYLDGNPEVFSKFADMVREKAERDSERMEGVKKKPGNPLASTGSTG